MSPISRCSESKPIWFDETSIPALCWISQPVPAVVLPIAICLLFAFAKYKQHQERQRQPRQPGKYQQHDHDHVRPDHQMRLSNACWQHTQRQLPDSQDLTTELLRIAAFITPFFSSLLVSNYLTTCIGWLPLLGIDLERPSFTGDYYLGAFAFLGAWMIMSLPALARGDRRRAKRQPWSTCMQESVFDAEAVGWAVTLQLAVWLFLEAGGLFW
jgi:hypothetical protein